MLRPVKSPILHEISSINEPSVTHFVNQILVNVMNMATKRFNCNNMYLKKVTVPTYQVLKFVIFLLGDLCCSYNMTTFTLPWDQHKNHEKILKTGIS